MQNFQNFLLDKNAIFADVSGENLTCAVAKNSQVVAESEIKGGALENLYKLISESLKKANLEISQISLFAFCLGTGSILSIRTNSAAFSTMRACQKDAILASWNLLDCYAKILNLQGKSQFSIVCASRKNFANSISLQNGNYISKEIPSSEIKELAKPVFFINQRKNSDANFKDLQEVFFSASKIFELLKSQPELLSVYEKFETPDALTLAKREYVKWNSQEQV